MPSQELESLRERLVAMYDEARALGQHQVAYHALAAVLHAGESLHDIDTIDLVEKRAKEHAAWLNVNDPGTRCRRNRPRRAATRACSSSSPSPRSRCARESRRSA